LAQLIYAAEQVARESDAFDYVDNQAPIFATKATAARALART
jgi:hypothetical protein